MNHDVMLRGVENSPMLSSYSPSPPSSVPEPSLCDVPVDLLDTLITDPFADVPLKGSRSTETFLDMLSEAYSPNANQTTLQEFLINQDLWTV